MKKKLLLIFLVILIVIFLIVLFNNNDNIEESINNTIEYLEEKDYRYDLTLKDIYYVNNKNVSTKIKYTEIRKDNLYKFETKYYNNDNLSNNSIFYIKNNDDKYTYYYFDGKSYKEEEIENITEKKEFDINIKEILKKIKTIDKVKRNYYKSSLLTEDAFSLVYKNSNNSDVLNNTDVFFKTKNNLISSISFKTTTKDKKEEFIVNLNIDYSLQEIDFETK